MAAPAGQGRAQPSLRKFLTRPSGPARACASISPPAAVGQRPFGLVRGAGGAVERSRQLQMRRGEPQPFAADVVDVSEDCSDGTSLAPWWLGAPRAGVEMFEQELV